MRKVNIHVVAVTQTGKPVIPLIMQLPTPAAAKPSDITDHFKLVKIQAPTHEYTYTHNIINMQSITQFSQSATLRVNANKASLNKSSKKVSVQVRAAVSMPSMDSQDEGDDVVASNPEAFVPQAPAAQKGNAVFS